MNRKYFSLLVSFFLFLLLPIILNFESPIKAEPVEANISGDIFFDVEETQILETSVNVSLAINGVYIDTVSATEDYIFSQITVDEGDVLTIYLDGNEEKAVTLTKVSTGADNTNIINNLYVNYLTFYSTGSDAVTHQDIDLANNVNDSDIDNFYESEFGLAVWNGYSVLVTENISITTDTLTIDGNLIVRNNAAIDTETIYLYSNLENYGIISSTVINFYGDSDQDFFSTGTFENLDYLIIHKEDGGAVYLQSDINIPTATVSISGTATLDLYGYQLYTKNVNILSGQFRMNDNGFLNLDNGQGSLYMDGGYFEGNANDLTMNTLSLNYDASFVSSSNFLYLENLSVYDSMFWHNGGTVAMLNEVNSIESGAFQWILFNNFYMVDPEEDGISFELSVSERTFINIVGTLTLIGNGEDFINLYSTGEDPFYVELVGPSSATDISNIRVYNSELEAFDGSLVTLPINPLNSINDGQTVGWFNPTRTIMGNALLSNGSDSLGEGHEVIVAIDGSEVTTVTTNEFGEFIVENLTIEDGDVIFLYLNGNQGSNGTTILKIGSDETIFVAIYQNYLTLDGQGGYILERDDLLSGHTGDGAINYYQSELNDNNLLFVTSGLYISNTSLVDLDVSAEIAGQLKIDGEVNLHEGDITLQGNLTLYGILETEGKITFTGGGNLTIETALWTPIPTDVEINDFTAVTVTTETVIDGTLNVSDGSILDCGGENKTETLSSATFTDSSYSCEGVGDFEVNGTLLLDNSNFSLPDGYMEVNSLEVTNSSTLTAGQQITIEESFTLSDDSTFIPNQGEVLLEGYENNLTGNIPFHNLIKLVQYNDSPSSITFSSGSTFPITGELALVGYDENDLLAIKSSSESEQFTIEMLGFASFGQLEYLEVINSIIYGLDSELEFPINPINSMNLGNTIGWFDIDNITEQIIFSSPDSNTTHSSHIPINVEIPEAMLTGSLKLSFIFGETTYTLTLNDIDAHTPKIFKLNINNVIEGGHFSSVEGLEGFTLPDGTYTLIASFQDAMFNQISHESKTNITIDRNAVDPEESPEEDEDDNEEENETSEQNQNTGNSSQDNHNRIISLYANMVNNQSPVSSPVATASEVETNINANDTTEITSDNFDDNLDEDEFEYTFPWWIIIIIVALLIMISLWKKRNTVEDFH